VIQSFITAIHIRIHHQFSSIFCVLASCLPVLERSVGPFQLRFPLTQTSSYAIDSNPRVSCIYCGMRSVPGCSDLDLLKEIFI